MFRYATQFTSKALSFRYEVQYTRYLTPVTWGYGIRYSKNTCFTLHLMNPFLIVQMFRSFHQPPARWDILLKVLFHSLILQCLNVIILHNINFVNIGH